VPDTIFGINSGIVITAAAAIFGSFIGAGAAILGGVIGGMVSGVFQGWAWYHFDRRRAEDEDRKRWVRVALEWQARYGVDSLRFADLRGAYLSQVDLGPVSPPSPAVANGLMFGSRPRHADLRQSRLSGADLSDANLTGADLSGADLRTADLSNSVLFGADLSGADIAGTSFEGADLIGTHLATVKNYKQAWFAGATYTGEGDEILPPTQWPDGWLPSDAKKVERHS
jgi:hypothetical protein